MAIVKNYKESQARRKTDARRKTESRRKIERQKIRAEKVQGERGQNKGNGNDKDEARMAVRNIAALL
jgi:hypothetical protein